MAKNDEEELTKIHTEAMECFALVEDAEREQRQLAIEDMLFVDSESGQWDEQALAARKNRPMYTVDLVSEGLNQIIGDQRQSRTRIKIDPDGGGADVDTANIFDGLIRNIEKQSSAENAYDNAFKEALKGGYGGWRYLTAFNDDDAFEQDIIVEPIYSAASSLYFNVDAKKYDKSDATKCWLITDLSIDAFKEEYPEATITDFNKPEYRTNSCKNWFSNDSVRVAEYWVKEPTMRRLALLSDGRVIDKDEEADVLDELAAKGITIVKERSVKSHNVVMYKMNGAEILEGPHKWAGKYIPIVPEYGEISHVEGRTYVRGKVRKAKDSQRIYNYTTSAKIETAALSPKDPIFVTDVMIGGYQDEYETMNTANKPVIRFKPDPEAPGLMPSRIGAPQVQQALIEQTQQAASDVHSTMGIHAPALGNAPQLLSEKSVINQAEMGDRGSFEYRDNLEKSKAYGGKILVDLIPRIYDTPRMIQVLNMDGSVEEHHINQQALDDFNQPVMDEESGEVVIVNDLKKGKYAVSVETGPTSKTMRDETVKQLTELAALSPETAALTTDLIAKNMNIIESDELTKRLRKPMILSGTIEPTDDEIEELGLNQPQAPDPQKQALVDNVNMQTEEMMAGIEQTDAETQKTLVSTQTEAIDAYKKLVEAFEKQVAMGVSLTEQQKTLLVTQGDIVAGAQDIIEEGMPNSEQATDIIQQLKSGQLTEQDLQ